MNLNLSQTVHVGENVSENCENWSVYRIFSISKINENRKIKEHNLS